MAKQSLREFQAQLAERLKSAAREGRAAKLAFMAGGLPWLADLTEINEVVTAAEITPVPWAQPWFVGLANVRGQIYGCTDLAAFLGEGEASNRVEGQLLIVSPRLGINAALYIDRTLGLRHAAQMAPLSPQAEDAEWIRARWRTTEGQEWREISLERLVASPRFLEAGSEPAAPTRPKQA